MNTPTATELMAHVEATWPAASTTRHGPWTIRQGAGGGSRVSATSVHGAFDLADIEVAEAQMAALGQPKLFVIQTGQQTLDHALAARGYAVKDPVTAYVAPTASLIHPRPAVSCFEVWPPLAIQAEIWAQGGIGPTRIAVMARAKGAKVALLGRVNDSPGGAAFVAMSGNMAMLHALEIAPAQRRVGLAGQMMSAAAEWAQSQNAGWVSVIVTRANKGANALYASLGMQKLELYHYRTKPEP